MPSTVPCPWDGTLTNDQQLYDELLGVSDPDPAWGPRNDLGPSVVDQFAHPLLLPWPSAVPDIDGHAPSALPELLAPRYDPVPAPMAAPPFDSTFPGESLFNIHSDANPTFRPPTPAAPNGECNFLLFYTPGANPVKCGCRRFWSSNAGPMTVGDALAADPNVCMCSHHACYHDDLQTKPAQAPAATTAPEDGMDKTKGALTPLQDISFRFTPGKPAMLDLPELNGAVETADVENPLDTGFGLHHIQETPGPDGSLPDTLCWGDTRQSPSARVSTLPPIPSQCLMPSRPSSVAESSQSRYLRPFAGRGLGTLSSVRNSQNGRQPLQERVVDPEPAMARVVEEPRGDGDHLGPGQQERTRFSGPNPSQDLGDTQPFGSPSGLSREAARNLSDTVEAHEQRLDRLETVSFSVAGHEECTDKHDQMDLRVTELESRVGEVERGMNDNSSHTTAHAARSDRFDGSTCSVVSDNTSATARPMHSFEVRSQFQSMEAQISRLQAALPPSFEAPWEVEVVFLPFPLRKLWQESREFREPADPTTDEWTQLPNTYSAATMRAQSPIGGEWARGHDFEWLLPKACVAKGLVDQRLRSRGLVRTISVKGPDARSVQAAMNSVFGGVMRDMRAAAMNRSRRQSMSSRSGQFHGLSNEWVPLRKIHKDSRLRFLSPAEMVTPALWNVQFLNSVLMKSSEPRLFVTQPEAYTQDIYSYEAGWTWRRLRELPRFYPEVGGPGEIPEADALEEHWAYNKVLDEPPGRSRSSTPAPPEAQHMPSSPSQQYFTTVESMFRSTPSRGTTPAPPRPRKKPQLPHIRTNSMPPSATPFISPSANRRVISSGSGDRQVMAPVRGASGAVTKRRTRSPSARARFTPRWSTKSPSPVLGAVRSTTPFNYATPYSNGPPEPQPAYVAGQQADSADEDFDINIFDEGSFYDYEDEDDEDASLASVQVVPQLLPGQNSPQLPEDEPWPGIEDGENVDPREEALDGDGDSEMSSQPSEYPSTQVWNGGDAGFQIHED